MHVTGYKEKIEEVVRATHIHSSTTFSWFGVKSPHLTPSVRDALDPETARLYLLYNLQTRLYTDFYCKGYAARSRSETGLSPLSGATPFVKRLSAANSGQGQWADGWRVHALQEREVVVTKGGVTVWAPPHDCRVPGDQDLTPGTPMELRLPPGLVALSPGYYMALSTNRLRAEDAEPLVRFYWNVTPDGAPAVMQAVTTALNGPRYPFRFKILNDPTHFTRCDAAVLYIRKCDYARIAAILERIYGTISQYLKPNTPALARQLAPGLGFAEDPGGGESFGQHRCRIIAEGLVRAYELGTETNHARLDEVIKTFHAAKLNMETPYLNPGAGDDYPFHPSPITHHPSRPVDTHTPGSYLHTAITIARAITRDALWHDGICNWLGAELQPNTMTGRYDLTYAALGPAIYTGTAGIALFLGELWAVRPEEVFLRTALGAMRHALSQVDIITPATRPGLYSGWAGIALVASRLGRLFGEEELTGRACQLIIRLAQISTERWEVDLLSGMAGTIAALPILSDYLNDSSLLDYAARLADDVLRMADHSRFGSSWRSSINRSFRNLTGLSHGASGIGYALLELWQITRDARYLQGAEAAFSYERSWFDPAAANWPDFRLEPGDAPARNRAGPNGLPATNKTTDRTPAPRRPSPATTHHSSSFANAWCNGAPGIALSRLRAFDLLKRSTYRSEALFALQSTSQAVESSLHSGSGNYSLCHGLSGNAEILLMGQQALGGEWHSAGDAASLAATVAARGIKSYGTSGTPWPCGIAHGDTPNLMLGRAGIGYFYLRLYEPAVPTILLLRREDWTADKRVSHPPTGS